jgi:predicted transcriptional regulator
MRRAKTPLGDLEHRVMQLVWTHGEVTAEDIRKLLASNLKEATVRTVLRRLEEKGLLSHTVRERTFVYSAAQSRGHVAAKAVKRVVDWICGGSVEEVLVGMVDARMVDRATVEKLSKRIEQAGAERPLRRARKPVKR